ncbi:hypothetical protein B0H67DRAFT_604447 [Lasiosphaeris hirsuta]|uniref:Uncharacterized protein n=1 Tax=Lasiosphaeris hirsuta TaxID=260670 RepID=A0AA40DIM0_9PEZI|nr:hypothetical protein B0H67DRAFT_604447 [Lasiosphaeris hirsuta]
MASGTFFDYSTALRLAPVITASATLTFAGNQQWIFELFTRPDLAAQSKTFLPPWFSAAFWIGMPKVVGLATASAIGGVLNLRNAGPTLRISGAYGWYACGAVLAAAHVLFVPALVARAKGVAGDTRGEGRCLGEMKAWLRVNAVRTLTVDTGAWICFFIATVKALGPV